jgi:hypothetical protein
MPNMSRRCMVYLWLRRNSKRCEWELSILRLSEGKTWPIPACTIHQTLSRYPLRSPLLSPVKWACLLRWWWLVIGCPLPWPVWSAKNLSLQWLPCQWTVKVVKYVRQKDERVHTVPRPYVWPEACSRSWTNSTSREAELLSAWIHNNQ